MSNTQPQMVHEAEAQRQYARIVMNANATIAKRTYQLVDFSNGGIALETPAESQFAPQSIHEAELNFQFDGFNMALPIALQTVSAGQRTSFKFYEPNRRQLSIIQYIVTAYIGGEIVQMQDIMDVAARNNMTKARKIEDPTKDMSSQQLFIHNINRYGRFALVGAFTLLLLGYIITSAYERLYIVKATSAEVTAEMLTVDTPAGGKIYYYPIAADTKVKTGQPLLTVSTMTGNILSVDSPCDCIVKRQLLANNRLAKKGEPALELVQPNTKPFVKAYVSYDSAVKLAVKQEVLIALPGHDVYIRGEINNIQAAKSVGGNSLVLITPLEPLPISYIDDPVEIRIDTAKFL